METIRAEVRNKTLDEVLQNVMKVQNLKCNMNCECNDNPCIFQQPCKFAYINIWDFYKIIVRMKVIEEGENDG